METLPAGTLIFAQGDKKPQFVYLLSGQVVLSSDNQPLETITAATPRARQPLASTLPRQVSATALTEVALIRLDSELLECLITWGQFASAEPEVVMSGDGVFTVDKGSWLKKMAKSPTFKNLPPANIEQLLDKLEPIKVEAGEIIIRQGDQGDYFYMIDKGSVLVHRQTGDEEDESIELAELTEGSSFGEAALISDKPRNATVSMMSSGILLRLSKEDFLKLLTEPNVHWVTFTVGQALAAKGNRWIDIRLPREFAAGHIPGAINIPVQQLHRRARELPKSCHYICYCDTGRRSSAASFILKQYGVSTCVLKEGIQNLNVNLLEKGA